MKIRKNQRQPERQEMARIPSDPSCGLTSAQAEQLQAAGYDNQPVDAPFKTTGQIVRDNVFTFFNLVFIVLGVWLALVGAFKDMLFLLIIVANTAIGIFQQLRSKKTLDKLTLLSSPHAVVVRDGKRQEVRTEQLVRDDIVLFSAGNQISADAMVVQGEMQVDESLLTGESDPVSKRPGDQLLSGCFVLSGKCSARLERVGADSYAARLTVEAKKHGGVRRSEMMASLDKLIRVIGFALIPIGIILFCKQLFVIHLPLYDASTATVAALIGMIPEGLYLLTSVALAVSVIKLARNRTLVHEMSCIETLARVDVLCVDKTGTITEPEMAVSDIVPLNANVFDEKQAEKVLGEFYAVMDIDNNTARAMHKRFTVAPEWTATKIVPFLSSTKWSAIRFAQQGAYLVGAPECILREEYARLRPLVEEYSSKGKRVLLLAQLDGSVENNKIVGVPAPLALVLLENPIRENAPATFRYFAEQGVQIRVISGDNPVTVSRVAQNAGIANAEQYVDASTLQSDEAIAQAVEKYTVFGRVTPEQKRKFVQTLKKHGHTVAMTGDGVNDVLALKDANVGVAMASGSEAASQAAHLVLLDSDFAAMPKVVAEGRRVINNIERAASLFLVKNIFSFFLALFALCANFSYPVTPLQLSLISALTIGAPSLFLAIEPNKALVKGRFMRNVLGKALPGGVTCLLLVLMIQITGAVFDFTHDQLSTMCTLLLAVNGLVVLFQVCRPFDIQRRIIFGLMTAGMIVAVAFFGGFFSLELLPVPCIVALIPMLLLDYPFLAGLTCLFHRLGNWEQRMEQRLHRMQKKIKANQAAEKK